VADLQLTTEWVLSGQTHAFAVMYHHRVLAGEPSPLPRELRDVDRAVHYWEGAPAVRGRIEALRAATAYVWMFLELLPQTLGEWLDEQAARGGQALENACQMVERELHAAVDFMGTNDFLHLDAHVDYDRSYVFTQLIRWLTSLDTLPPGADRVVQQYAPVAAITAPFQRELQTPTRAAIHLAAAQQTEWRRTPRRAPLSSTDA